MSELTIRERGAEMESDVARAWWRLAPRTLLPLANGGRCLLIYSGQPGGAAGPDVRDAVLLFLARTPQEEELRLAGDVEFHLRASDWCTHGHQNDPRYNRVILHVVHYLDSPASARRQDGSVIPTCSLLDFPQSSRLTENWPCQLTPLTPQALTSTLLYAGLRRFHEKRRALGNLLATATPTRAWSRYDACLLPALAEGLGYGRDRDFFRAAGLRLLGLPASLPEPLGRAPEPAPLDARRLRILRLLLARWQETGAWSELRRIVEAEKDVKATLTALRAAFSPLSQGRTDILITNIVLPFAAAVAALENAPTLAARAQHLYLAYPGLVSNRVTRMMSAQLHLSQELERACLQQGLHDIYTRTCQAKDCQNCLCGGQRL